MGAAIIVLMSGRDHKNPVLRLALGLYDIYNLTGWLSDLLSYSRLLALGLATGVIAQVINQMGSMAGDGIIRSHSVHHRIYSRTSVQPCDQHAGSIRAHMPSPVCTSSSANSTKAAAIHSSRSGRIRSTLI